MTTLLPAGTATVALKVPLATTAATPLTVTETESSGSAAAAAPCTSRLVALVYEAFFGALSESAGCTTFARTWVCTTVALPAASTALTAMVFAPATSFGFAEKLPSAATATSAPATVSLSELAS